MPDLRQDHSYLYKRVRLKMILHTALGLVLLLLPSSVPGQSQPQTTGVNTIVSHTLTYFGAVYLLIGLLLGIGLFRPGKTYRFLRGALTFAALYNTMWLLIIIAIAVQTHLNRSIAYIGVIYGYLTYNLWYVRNDPGWRAIEVVKEFRKEARDEERARSASL